MINRFKEAFREARQRADESWYNFMSTLMRQHGVEMTNSPRELQAHLAEIIPQATEIKMAVDAEELFLFELPRPYTPDKWEDLIEMMGASIHKDSLGIEIVRPPIGTPPEIAEAWVGLTIPFSPTIPYPLLFVTPELAEMGLRSSDRKGYMIDSKYGINLLEMSHPQAAQSYKNLRPTWADEARVLIFDGDSAKMVEITKNPGIDDERSVQESQI